MIEKEIKIKQITSYKGHSLKDSGAVDLKLLAPYSELVNSVKLLQMLNNDVKLKVKLPEQKAMVVGIFRIKSVIFDNDGESIIKLNGVNDHINLDCLNKLPMNGADVQQFNVMYESTIEIEEDEEEDE